MSAGWQRPGEKARPVWRVHRLLGISKVQVHPANHHGHQMPEMQRRRICEAREHGQRRTRKISRLLRVLAISRLRFHDAEYAHRPAVPKVWSAVRSGKENEDWDSLRLHQRRMRLGKAGARRETGDRHAARRSPRGLEAIVKPASVSKKVLRENALNKVPVRPEEHLYSACEVG